MRKAPAFQFYTTDWLEGTMHMTAQEKGVYIDLLALQWTRGRLTDRETRLLRAAEGEEVVAAVLEEKFERQPDGSWRNRRLEDVRNLSNIRRESASKGGSKAQAKRQANGKAKSEQNGKQEPQAKSKPPTPSPTPSPIPIPDPNPECENPPAPEDFGKDFSRMWVRWRQHLLAEGKPLNAISQEQQLYTLSQAFESDEAEMTAAVAFSIQRQARGLITDGSHRQGAGRGGGVSGGLEDWLRKGAVAG